MFNSIQNDFSAGYTDLQIFQSGTAQTDEENTIFTDTEETTESEETNAVTEYAAQDEVKVVAHRGYSYQAPENTIPAFEKAAENGYDTVECDIGWTKDDVPVIIHDSTINRTARNSIGFKPIFPKWCSDMTYDKLQKYDFGSWFSSEYKGTKIPTFDELLQCGSENNLDLYVELKEGSGFDEEKAQILLQSLEGSGMEDKITWISFDESYLEIIKNLMPDARLGYLSRSSVSEDTIDTLDSLKTDGNEVFLDIKSSKIDEEGSEMLSDAGYDFEAWTVNSSDKLSDLAELNCKGITTDKLSKDEVVQIFSSNG